MAVNNTSTAVQLYWVVVLYKAVHQEYNYSLPYSARNDAIRTKGFTYTALRYLELIGLDILRVRQSIKNES